MHRNVAALQSLARISAKSIRAKGLGIPGPWGNIPKEKIDAGRYEITGTQVFLRSEPKIDSMDEGAFNGAYGDNGGIVVGAPDQVDFNGQTADADGLRWAMVQAVTGPLAGKAGYVAMKYMAIIGWTEAHGGTSSAPMTPAQKPQIEPASTTTTTTTTTTTEETDWTKWIVGGLVAVGVAGIGYALFGTKKGKAVRRLARIKYKRRRGGAGRRAYA